MLVYGTGQGHRTFGETQKGSLFGFCALRPPHNVEGFSRTFGSANWKPLPFGIEGPWNLSISNDKNELSSSQISTIQNYVFLPENAIIFSYDTIPSVNQIHYIFNMNALMYMMADSGKMSQTHRFIPSDSYISVTGTGESLFQGQFIFPTNSSIFSSDSGQAVSQTHNLRSADSYISVTGTVGEINQIYFIRCIDSVSFLSNSTIDLSQIYKIIPLDSLIDIGDNLKDVFLSPWINTGRSDSKLRTYQSKFRRINESLVSDNSRNIRYQTKRKSMNAEVHHSRQGDKQWQNPVRRKSY